MAPPVVSPAPPPAPPATTSAPPSSPPVAASRKPHNGLRVGLIALGTIAAALAGLIAVGLLLEDHLNTTSTSIPTATPTPTQSQTPTPEAGWTLKQGEGQTLYAVVAPRSATLNLMAVVLACEVGDGGRALHLQIYPSTPGPFLPNGATREQLKDEPAVQLEIDGAVLPAQLDFAGDFAIVYDRVANGLPTMTPGLASALERGNELTLRFDLVREPAGTQRFDAYAVVALKSPNGAGSIAAVRRSCGQ